MMTQQNSWHELQRLTGTLIMMNVCTPHVYLTGDASIGLYASYLLWLRLEAVGPAHCPAPSQLLQY